MKASKSKSMPEPDKFRILTANVFAHNYGMPKIVYDSDFDMLCLQEGPYTRKILDEYFSKADYDIIWSPKSESSQLFCVLCKKNGWRLSTTTNFNSATNAPQSVMEEVWNKRKNFRDGSEKLNYLTARTALVVSLTNEITSQTIKVANLHLCGGRYDERVISTPTVTMQNYDIKGVKNGLLTQVLEHDPDIVVGDFNSDVVCYVDRCRLRSMKRDSNDNDTSKVYIHDAQLKFWENLAGCDDDYDYYGKDRNRDEIRNETRNKLQEWNCAPFELLESRSFELAYEHAAKTDENSYAKGVIDMFQHHGTSLYGTTPDAIWYKTGTKRGDSDDSFWERRRRNKNRSRIGKRELRLTAFQRMCLMPRPPHTHKEMVSDHDALCATFRFGS